jgi:beta-glucosidase-like glycosyl hydrolase
MLWDRRLTSRATRVGAAVKRCMAKTRSSTAPWPLRSSKASKVIIPSTGRPLHSSNTSSATAMKITATLRPRTSTNVFSGSIYSVPFRMGFLEGGAKAVMASYNAWNGTPMAINPILRSIVINQWGLDVISSDGGAVKLLVDPRHLFLNQQAAVLACLKAGINQFLDKYADETKAALKDGSLTITDIDGALRLKFRIAIKLGLLDLPEMVPYSNIKDSPEPWNTDKHRDISRPIALESVVLLKNDKNFLPLDKNSIKSIAVIGPLADSVHWDWYGGTPPYAVTPLQGVKDAVGANVTVNYAAEELAMRPSMQRANQMSPS